MGSRDTLSSFIKKNVQYDLLPAEVREMLGQSKVAYKKEVLDFCVKHQVEWSTSLAKYYVNEDEYYEKLVNYSLRHLMLYPYHLVSTLSKGLRRTPFTYYSDMLSTVIKAGKSYDTLPNFTAADCLRLCGIGRNQYIELMNTSQKGGKEGKKLLGRRLSSMSPGSSKDGVGLPKTPVRTPLEPWWLVNAMSSVSRKEWNLSPAENVIVMALASGGPRPASDFDYGTLQDLQSRGVIYIDVPIHPSDKLYVPPLQSFVVNRVQGDFFERLMYDIFVSIDEATTISQLARELNADVDDVRTAASVLCRLGFARKKHALNPQAPCHETWRDRAGSFDEPATEDKEAPEAKRIALLVDSTLIASLMMGNLAAGLSQYAVTLFEAGKLPDETIASFLDDLDKVDHSMAEGEAVHFFEHAVTLMNTLKWLRSKELRDGLAPGAQGGLDLLRYESLDTHARNRVMRKRYGLVLSMAPLVPETPCFTSSAPVHFGPAIPEWTTPWARLFIYTVSECGPVSILYPHGTRVRTVPPELSECQHVTLAPWMQEPSVVRTTEMLAALNAVLMTGPVLVQACGDDETVDVPFPLKSKSPGVPHDLESHPAIAKLNDRLALESSMGFIRMIKRVSTGDADGHTAWMPLALYFGVPMFDKGLNRAVCERVLESNLMRPKGVAMHLEASRRAALDLLSFAHRTSGEETSQPPPYAPMGKVVFGGEALMRDEVVWG